MTVEHPEYLQDAKEHVSKKIKLSEVTQDTEIVTEQQETEPIEEDTQNSESLTPEPSEMIYKLVLNNVNKFFKENDVKKLCKALDIQNMKVKKAPKWTHAFLTFASEAEQMSAMEKLRGQVWKKQEIQVRAEEPQVARPAFVRREVNNADRPEDLRTPTEKLADQVTPLWRKTYQEQLEMKQQKMSKLQADWLKTLQRNHLYKKDVSIETRCLLSWTQDASKQYNKMPCELLPIVPSPIQHFYRNKCEFSFGKNAEGQVTLGFMMGLYKEGTIEVRDPQECLHVTEAAKQIVRVITDYVSQSEYSVFDRVQKTGFWRLVQTRTQTTGEGIHPLFYFHSWIPS